ncbi:MAG: histidinol-phosphate transaminase [Lachnospiraceae bacterium]|nr:histidinol-phosphate transaminase [Lachnospiraceae bacterium]
MAAKKEVFHGSDLEKIEAVYGIKKEAITSFSANVNPLGISTRLRRELTDHLDAITTYPDRDYKELRDVMAAYTGTHPDRIIVGNGSTELISLSIRVREPKKAIIIGPTYSEYEREIRLGGGSAKYYPLKEENDFNLDITAFCQYLTDDIDLCIICNPNNPTSTAIDRAGMRRILDACLSHGIFVVVDETYVEFAPDSRGITAVPLTDIYSNLLILRGTSKFFAAPGLRLGYAITGNRDLREAINNRKNPWTANSLAEIAGRIMLTDTDYIEATKTLINEERNRMISALEALGTVKVYPADANFILFRILKPDVDADQLFEHCIRKGLMIRNCASFPFLDNSFVRFCLMEPAQNDALMEAFRELLG